MNQAASISAAATVLGRRWRETDVEVRTRLIARIENALDWIKLTMIKETVGLDEQFAEQLATGQLWDDKVEPTV